MQKSINKRADDNNKKFMGLLSKIANKQIDVKSKEFKMLKKEATQEHKALMAEYKVKKLTESLK